MICRIWHGWTPLENADAYENLLKEEIFVNIENRKIDGFNGIQLNRRNVGAEEEFVTIMWFDSIDSARDFAGEDYESAVVPSAARKLLSRWDEKSQHYVVKEERGIKK